MKNFKIYCVSNEDNSKYEISLNELVTNGNYTEDEVCKLLDYIETTKYKTTNIVLHILNSEVLYIVIKLNTNEIKNRSNKTFSV